MNVRVFNQHLIILSNYEDATKLMYEAKYSDRLQTVMLQELYVSPIIPVMLLICFETGWASTGALGQCPMGQTGAVVVNSYMSSSTDMKPCITLPNKRGAFV